MISAFRLAWAPLVDRFGSARRGHYRSWLLVLQPSIVPALLSMALVQPGEDLGFLLFIGFVVAVLSATQDIAVDAIAIRLLHAGRRGVANGIQVAGGYVGSLVGGGLSLVVHQHLGGRGARRGPDHRHPRRTRGQVPGTSASNCPRTQSARQFRHPGQPVPAPARALWVLVVLPLYWTGTYAAYSLIAPMLVDAGWPAARIGLVLNVLSSLVAIAGALGAGALKVAFAASSTVIGTVSMGLSRTETAGADYSALACVGSAIAFAAGAAALTLAGRVGYVPVLVATIGVAAGGVGAARLTNAASGFGQTSRIRQTNRIRQMGGTGDRPVPRPGPSRRR